MNFPFPSRYLISFLLASKLPGLVPLFLDPIELLSLVLFL